MSRIDLAIVLISRNQLWNVERLIRSVLRAIPKDIEPEIVLVDSASTDGTPEAAARFSQVLVVRIADDEHICPAAGRALGSHLTDGDLVLFLDGDAELLTGWLEVAITLFQGQPDLAAVTGSRETPASTPFAPIASDAVRAHEVKRTGGSALYRRAALDAVGGFDPFLFSEEEPELTLRLRHHGWRLLRTERPIIVDRSDPADHIRTVLARRRRRLYLGTGQVLRKHLGSPIASTYARERWQALVATGAFIMYLIAITAIALFSPTAAVRLGLILPIAAMLGLMLWFRDLGRLALFSVRLVCHVEGTVRGFIRRPRGSRSFSPRYVIVAEQEGSGA